MKSVIVKMSEELHMNLKIRLIREGKTINNYIVELIEEDMKKFNVDGNKIE